MPCKAKIPHCLLQPSTSSLNCRPTLASLLIDARKSVAHTTVRCPKVRRPHNCSMPESPSPTQLFDARKSVAHTTVRCPNFDFTQLPANEMTSYIELFSALHATFVCFQPFVSKTIWICSVSFTTTKIRKLNRLPDCARSAHVCWFHNNYTLSTL